MQKLFDQIDSNGKVVASGILLLPGQTLPTGHKWVPHTPSLASLKHAKKALIEATRDAQCFKHVEALGYSWQADRRSQELLTSSILYSQVDRDLTPKTWRTANNIDVPVALGDLQVIAAAISNQVNQAYKKSWELKKAVAEASSPQELDNISW